jgi:hypothetical protein
MPSRASGSLARGASRRFVRRVRQPLRFPGLAVSRRVFTGFVPKLLLPAPPTQLRAESQLQNLVGRELHPVRLQRVPLYLGDELRFVIGVNLESAVALKYRLHESPLRATLETGRKMRESFGKENG